MSEVFIKISVRHSSLRVSFFNNSILEKFVIVVKYRIGCT